MGPPSNEAKTEKGMMLVGGSMQDHCRASTTSHQYIIIHEQEGDGINSNSIFIFFCRPFEQDFFFRFQACDDVKFSSRCSFHSK